MTQSTAWLDSAFGGLGSVPSIAVTLFGILGDQHLMSHSLASRGTAIPAGNGPWTTDAGREM